jgi:hypothetical protein
MKRWKRGGVIALLSIAAIFIVFYRNFRLPIGVWHFSHLILPPKDLYKSIVVDVFPFWVRGFSKSYSLNPKYMDIYEIGLLSTDENFPSDEKFTGKVKVQFLSEGETVFESEMTSIQGGVYAGNDMKKYKKISLLNFEIPFKGKFTRNLVVRLTVLEPDTNIEKYGSTLQLFIAVSSSP